MPRASVSLDNKHLRKIAELRTELMNAGIGANQSSIIRIALECLTAANAVAHIRAEVAARLRFEDGTTIAQSNSGQSGED